jgi:hypothetical protein
MLILNPMLLPMATVLTIAMRSAARTSKTLVLMRTSFSAVRYEGGEEVRKGGRRRFTAFSPLFPSSVLS